MITALFCTKVPTFDKKINQEISNLCCEKYITTEFVAMISF